MNHSDYCQKLDYCANPYQSVRRISRTVSAGKVLMGGDQPIRIQSMTTTNAEDVEKTVEAVKILADHGCEIVRITAPNLAAAKALAHVRQSLNATGYQDVPLVADIHFLPQAAMEAALHVEKVRINPGNFADKKKFAVKSYSDAAYALEIERLHETVSPLILRCKELGRCLRIGTNHGSLSDRILNRYGDTPMGMVESAMEFLRIARSHNFHNMVLSMKASNPRVMIQAYRLAAAKMAEEGMDYPFHLGVTEAGDGEDGRIKSTIGMGTLLLDGIGDTIRVSLTENPINELPIARALADRAHTLWSQNKGEPGKEPHFPYHPYTYNRRETHEIHFSKTEGANSLGNDAPVRVLLNTPEALKSLPDAVQETLALNRQFKDQRVEGMVFSINNTTEIPQALDLIKILEPTIPSFWMDVKDASLWPALLDHPFKSNCVFIIDPALTDWLPLIKQAQTAGLFLALKADVNFINQHANSLKEVQSQLILTANANHASAHAVGHYRALVDALNENQLSIPIWLRMEPYLAIDPTTQGMTPWLMESSLFAGSLLCDGIGDVLSLNLPLPANQRLTLSYNILQGSRNRLTKTEFVACPSCGRTLFDLETTTQKVRQATGHLKGLTIAVMGCIVNGPGEMADADFGYVGGAPGKINLYVKKDCVAYNIPEAEAVERLVALIKTHGKWVEVS
jgi:(E)-4-hydroxy-3-methylbut-2-enyl-diphosphate synthase